MIRDDDDSDDDGLAWLVLVNAEGQHALWPVGATVPEGWHETGPEGPRETCLAWVDRHWADLRPASLRGG